MLKKKRHIATIVFFTIIISYGVYAHLIYINKLKNKNKHLCSGIAEIYSSYMPMDWKPSGNNELDNLYKNKPIGFTKEVAGKIGWLHFSCTFKPSL
ncbi:MAG: hypothetical protein DI586_08830 [Micavibrio aeruginosavorus]|uniref:Uncharacterized protein n=1 Tax=Micavibrio aeruginosavorus TaxID=349221 RepID=A0A2W5HGR0_9BACT|nr:MAG: hypothetical protein DI586_08830 [Micavibrio aeruginosavorus]